MKRLVLLVMAGIVVGFAGYTVFAKQQGGMDKGIMMQKGGKGDMWGKHNWVMKCTKNCMKNMEDLSLSLTTLDEAAKAIEDGNTAEAKDKIQKVKDILNTMKESTKKCFDKMPTVNDRCPITGDKIDMMNAPAELTTTIYKGMKVGFCCPKCPPEWDRLSDAEKDAKLEKVRHKEPEQPGQPEESEKPVEGM